MKKKLRLRRKRKQMHISSSNVRGPKQKREQQKSIQVTQGNQLRTSMKRVKPGKRQIKKDQIIRTRRKPMNRSPLTIRTNRGSRSKRINDYISSRNWNAVIKAAKIGLEDEPQNHWLLTQIASGYYEKRAYRTAYRFIVKAILINRNC